MYGMVNNAMEQMVTARHGRATWETVRRKAGVDDDVFISNEPYPDEITYRLVAACADTLATPAPDILFAFGEHWVLETAREGYGPMMRAGGRSLKEFLLNLPHFHTRVAMMFPQLRPPHFVCTDVADHALTLHYHSERAGLTDFVRGLLSGLGKSYATPVLVTLAASRAAGDDHDIFLVRWESAD